MSRSIPAVFVVSSPVDIVVESPSGNVVVFVVSSLVDVANSLSGDITNSPSGDVTSSPSDDVVGSSSDNVIDSSSGNVVGFSSSDVVDFPSDNVVASSRFHSIDSQELAIYFKKDCSAYEWIIASNIELSFPWRDLKDVASKDPQELERYNGVTGVLSMHVEHEYHI